MGSCPTTNGWKHNLLPLDFWHKFKAGGTLKRYKARLIVNEKTQDIGIDCNETFSALVKPTTIHTIFSLSLSWNWDVHQLDVKNAFLHVHLNETIYTYQRLRFSGSNYPHYVCKLKKSQHGLKQEPWAWYQQFATYLLTIGFVCSKSDTSLFIYKRGCKINMLRHGLILY